MHERFVSCIVHHFPDYNRNLVWTWIEGKRKDTWLTWAWNNYQRYGCSKTFLKKVKRNKS